MQPLEVQDPRKIGPYILVGRLGAGGMGQVYLAQSSSGEYAAIKIMHARLAEQPEIAQRFEREIELCRRVIHPATGQILDDGEDNGRRWLATRYIPGLSLAEAIARHGPLGENRSRFLGIRMCMALRATHNAGLVHRDVKPANIILGPDGPVLIDPGIAYAPDLTALTSTGNRFASLGFASPEHLRGEIVTAASDVFSLGIVLAFTVLGEMLAPGENLEAARVSEQYKVVIRQCLARDPRHRPGLINLEHHLASYPYQPMTPKAWLPPAVTQSIHACRDTLAYTRIETLMPRRPSVPSPNLVQSINDIVEQQLAQARRQEATLQTRRELLQINYEKRLTAIREKVPQILPIALRLQQLFAERDVPPTKVIVRIVRKFWGTRKELTPVWFLGHNNGAGSGYGAVFLDIHGQLWVYDDYPVDFQMPEGHRFDSNNPGLDEGKCIDILADNLPRLIKKHQLPW